MGFWSREKHQQDGPGFSAGSRKAKPHSPTGWTTSRTSEASAPLKKTAEPGGFFVTGRKKKKG
jgi:hypothetical protein